MTDAEAKLIAKTLTADERALLRRLANRGEHGLRVRKMDLLAVVKLEPRLAEWADGRVYLVTEDGRRVHEAVRDLENLGGRK